jgi:nicotinamide riboside transporter PnuC
MKNLTTIEWIGTGVALTGSLLNAFVLKESYYLWFFSNLILLYVSFRGKHYGLSLVFFVQFLFTLIGIFYW